MGCAYKMPFAYESVVLLIKAAALIFWSGTQLAAARNVFGESDNPTNPFRSLCGAGLSDSREIMARKAALPRLPLLLHYDQHRGGAVAADWVVLNDVRSDL